MNKALTLLYSRHCLCQFHSEWTVCNFGAQRRRKLLALFILPLLMLCHQAQAATISIPAGSTQSQIQTYFNSATSTNNVIEFQAGTYAVGSGSLNLPCVSGGVTITGPVISPSYTSWGTLTYNAQTAILSSSSRSSMIFSVYGCTNAITVEYLQFANAGGINISPPSTNFTARYNSFVNIPCHSGSGCSYGEDQAFYIVNAGAMLTNFTAAWNQIGDANSCESPGNTMTSTNDAGGTCAGMFIETSVNGMTIESNSFYHLEEGVHILCNGDQCNGVSGASAPIPTISNVLIGNNDFQQVHRINLEDQPQGQSNIVLQNNSVWNPYSPQTFSMGFSLACCGGNAPYGLIPGDVQCYPGGPSCSSSTPAKPNVPIVEDNVLLQENTPNGYGWAYTIEWWGWGTQLSYNLLEGLSVNGGATWGAGSAPWAANYNTVCGPSMGSAIKSEGFNNIEAPSQTGNAFSPSCSATPTTAPTITASGTVFPATVTLTDAGNTSSTTPVPQGNVSIWYTTDGSTPAPNSGTSRLCNPTVGSTSCNFVLPTAATVKAIGMWGQGANPTSYPSGYAFAPSSVTTKLVSPGARVLTGAYLHANTNTMVTGQLLQFSVYGTYSDGSVSLLPDAEGSGLIDWNTSNHAVAKVTSIGHVQAMSAGTVNIEAYIGTIKSSPWTVTVRKPAPPVAPAAAARDTQAVAAAEPATVPAATAEPATSAAADGPAVAGSVAAGPVPASPGAPRPDGFTGPFWSLVTPAGGSASISNAHLFIGVPGGSNHDPLQPSNQAVRVVQAIGNEDFDVAIKIDSPLFATDANTSQGLMVLSDNADFITFALTTDGSRIGLNAHSITRGVATVLLEDSDFSQYQNPMYLRLTKSGSAYVALYSIDGVNWAQATSFTDTKATTGIGPFASNYNDTSANAVPVVMSVNWFDVLK
jgi:Bacterial Ig-like domain (group 2)